MKTHLALITASLLMVLTSCNQPGATSTETTSTIPATSELNKSAYREIVKAFETGFTDSLGKYVADNVVDHAPPVPGISSTGLQRLKELIALYRSSFPDMKMTFHSVVADENYVLAFGTWSGTNTGPFMGQPATNKSVSAGLVDIVRFENGKAVEHWEVSDQTEFLTQLGMMPQQGTPPPPAQLPAYDWNATVADDSAREAKMKEAFTSVMDMIVKGDLSNLGQYMATDFREHAQIPGVTLPPGIDGARQAMTLWKQVYPDLKTNVHQVVAEGDFLIAHFTMEGTYSGSFPDLPKEAAGKKVSVSCVDIIKFNSEGKAAGHWDVTDHYTEMVQLGVIPAEAVPSAN